MKNHFFPAPLVSRSAAVPGCESGRRPAAPVNVRRDARRTRRRAACATVSRFVAPVICGLWVAFHAVESMGGEAERADKSRYTLFRPTPRELLRELSTDRPDKTESPYTIDAGHFQVEADVLNYAYDRHNTAFDNTSVESVGIAPINLKVGLCNNADFQLVVETYNSVRVHDRAAGTVTKHRGFGDVIPRLKWNLWGNDGGRTALALMPYVKLPTNQDNLGNNSVEGGLIVPFALELPHGWGMGLMTEFDINRDDAGDGHHAEFVNSITFARDLIGALGGYVEFWSAVSAESDSDWVGTFDVGLTYGLTEDIQLDAGVNIGLTRSADDINPFLGVSWRF